VRVSARAAELAALIIRLHADEGHNADCVQAGLQLVRAELSADRIDGLMMKAVSAECRPAPRRRSASSSAAMRAAG
jgi:hypothetical protein